jgi:hypothetical protein
MTPFLLKLTLITSLAAHGADLASTQNCLGAGRCHEMNPALARFHSPAAFGAAKMTVAGLGTYGSMKLQEEHPKLAIVLNVAVTGAYSSIAYHNSQVGR